MKALFMFHKLNRKIYSVSPLLSCRNCINHQCIPLQQVDPSCHSRLCPRPALLQHLPFQLHPAGNQDINGTLTKAQ